MLLSNVKDIIRKYSLLAPGDRVLVAVSGGPDSVCLLHVLLRLAQELPLSLHVAHLDHRFRGAESAGEARFVAELAKNLKVPARIEQFDVPALCRERGVSAQTGAREARYAFLSRVAQEVGAARIATGHTANDQAETFLLRLVRGAGAPGLAGIPPIRDNIIRPLINVTRVEVMHYLASEGISFVSDPSNAKTVYARNRIRHELIPALERFNPRIVETLAAESSLLRDENDAVESCLDGLAGGVLEWTDGRISIVRDAFSRLHPAFQRRMLRRAIAAAGGQTSSTSLVQLEEARAFLLSAHTGRHLELPGGLQVIREYERFLFREQSAPVSFSAVLQVPGKTAVPALSLDVHTTILVNEGSKDVQADMKAPAAAGGPDGENYVWQALFDYDKIGSKIEVRNRLAGDWFCPSGMDGKKKKLQDFLVDLKVPRLQRDRIPLVVADGEIIWVAGLRTDERFLPGRDTERLLLIQVQQA